MRYVSRHLVRLTIVLLAGAPAAPSARATILADGDGTQNAAAGPPGIAVWDRVGMFPWVYNDPNGAPNLSGGSGVYLGDRWVLSGAHVDTSKPYVLPGVGTFQGDGTAIQLHRDNRAGPLSDLRLIRLAQDPGITGHVWFGATPAVGTPVTMIGGGWDRQGDLHVWHPRDPDFVNGSVWDDVTADPAAYPAYDLYSGYYWKPGMTRRWAANRTVFAAGFEPTTVFYDTEVIATRFDQGLPNVGQLVSGDSGGPLLVGNRLVGLALYLSDYRGPTPDLGQPLNTAVFGNLGFYANLARYADEIARVTGLHPSWDGDANLDGVVNFADYKILNKNFGTPTGADWSRGDFNLDGAVDILDFQMLERNFGAYDPALPPPTLGSGTLGPPDGTVPEPATASVVALAAGVLLSARRRRRA